MSDTGGVARIFLKDGSYKAVRVTGNTTVKETCAMFARRLQLPLLSDAYELRQVTPQGDRVLPQEARVWDVILEFSAHPDYDPLELQEEKVKYRLLFSFTEDMRTRLSVRVGLPPPQRAAPLGVSFLTPSNPTVPVSPFSAPSSLQPPHSPTPVSPPLSPTAGSLTMRRPPPPVPDRSSKGATRRQTLGGDTPPSFPMSSSQSQPQLYPQPTPAPATVRSISQPELAHQALHPPQPQELQQPRASQPPPGQAPPRQNRPLPQPLPRGQPRALPTTPPPAGRAPPGASVPVASHAPPPAARTEERDKDVDELASVIFRIEGLDQFNSVKPGQDTSAIFDLDDLLANLAKATNLA